MLAQFKKPLVPCNMMRLIEFFFFLKEYVISVINFRVSMDCVAFHLDFMR